MKSSIKREAIQISSMILEEGWEIKNIIRPKSKNTLEKIEKINLNEDLIIILRKPK